MSLDFTGWVDQQRRDGVNRGNVFADILKEAERRRAVRGDKHDARDAASRARVQKIRDQAARIDRHIESTTYGPIPARLI